MRSERCAPVLVALALAFGLLLFARAGVADLPPLARAMLENLGDVNRIGLSVAIDNFDGVAEAARGLRKRAADLQAETLEDFGIEDTREAQFDAYLSAQQKAATAILKAAGDKNADAVFVGVESLYYSSCVPCHRDFRDRHQLLRPSVAFMTDLLHSWQDINRGLSVNDLDLVMRRAREIQGVARVLTWNEVIGQVFSIEDTEKRIAFRQLAQQVSRHAGAIEHAAGKEQLEKAIASSRLMWSEGCIACHQRFR